MRHLIMPALLLLLPGCAELGGINFRGEPIGISPSRLNDAAYAAGARTGERLGIAPPAETPSAGEWRVRKGEEPARPGRDDARLRRDEDFRPRR